MISQKRFESIIPEALERGFSDCRFPRASCFLNAYMPGSSESSCRMCLGSSCYLNFSCRSYFCIHRLFGARVLDA